MDEHARISPSWESHISPAFGTLNISGIDLLLFYSLGPLLVQVLHYLGVAEQLSEPLVSATKAETPEGRKQLALALRLLTQAKRVLDGGVPDANIGEECKANLQRIKTDSIPENLLGGTIVKEVKATRENKKNWKLAAKADKAKLVFNSWLVGIRKSLM